MTANVCRMRSSTLGHAYPALSPALALLSCIPPGPRPSLRRLRGSPRVDRRKFSPAPRFPIPMSPKAGAVSTHDYLGPDDYRRVEDRWNPTIQRAKNGRSPLVNSIPPRTPRCSTTSWCRSATFSAPSRPVDLKMRCWLIEERYSCATNEPMALRFHHRINKEEVFQLGASGPSRSPPWCEGGVASRRYLPASGQRRVTCTSLRWEYALR